MKKVLVLTLSLSGCVSATTETERAMCDAWRSTLPTRSHSDTAQTQQEIGQARATFRAVCQ